MNSKISYAVAAILEARPAERTLPNRLPAVPKRLPGALEEITVTAQRRTESMQNVPISMQAFTAQRCSSSTSRR